MYPKPAVLEFKKLGTDIDIRIIIRSDEEYRLAQVDLADAKKIYEKYHSMFSRFLKGSEISKLNDCLGIFCDMDQEVLELAYKCLSYNKETEGYFDPRIIGFLEACGYDRDFFDKECGKNINETCFKKIKNSLSCDLKIKNKKIFFGERMDFSGIVKGWITDKVSRFLSKRGWKNFVVDSGGDMYFSGTNENDDIWTIEVDGIPYEKIMLGLSGKAIATSGIGKRKWEKSGKRFHHLINPKKPDEFSFDLRSVTVVADSVEEADVWAKTLFLMGREKGMAYSKEKSIKSLFLGYNGNVWISPELSTYRM